MKKNQHFLHGRGLSLGLCMLGMTSLDTAALNTPFTGMDPSTWRLQVTGDYQVVSEDDLPLLFAGQAPLCQSARPDGRKLTWSDADNNLHHLQLSNEQGVLRWWSATLPQQQIWSEGSHVVTEFEQLSEQLAVIPQAVSPKKLQLVWHEPAAKRYSAVDLSDPLLPKALWQWQPQGAGTVQTPVAARFDTSAGAASMVLVVSGSDAAQPAFWLIDAVSGKQLATQQYHTSKKTVELPFVLQDLVAAPAVLDRNADGYADRIYLVDVQGRLVQVDVDAQLQFQSRVVADLSDVGAEFKVQLVASRAIMPNYQQLAVNVAIGENQQPVAAGAAGQPADVVLLVSRKNQQSQLWALTIPDSPAFTIQPHHLTVRDLQQDVVSPALSSTTVGWYGTLPAAPVALPAVLAGVLYLPIAAQGEHCAEARQATQLIARHLFQGAAVYSDTLLAALPKPFGLIGAVQRHSGELALQDLQSGSILLSPLQGIREDCLFCTEALHQNLYPKWQRMAIYQHESELY